MIQACKKSIYLSAIACISALFSQSHAVALNNDFDVNDRLNSTFEAIQVGIDSLWPGDVDFDGFRYRIGIAAAVTPDYLGSNNYRKRVIPIIDIRYKDKWHLNGLRFTYNALKHSNFTLGPLIALRSGRGESRNSALAGLGDIPSTPEIGGFIRFKNKSMRIMADYRFATKSRLGRVARVSLGHGLYKSSKFALAAAIRGKWRSDSAMNREFGINRVQARRSVIGYDIFTASGGFSEITTNLLGAYKITEQSKIYGLLSYGRLIGDAQNSPLTGHGTNKGVGSANQTLVGVSVVWDF